MSLILSTDFGEEIDDYIAFSQGILKLDAYKYRDIFCIISGGKETPTDRLTYLSHHLKSLGLLCTPANKGSGGWTGDGTSYEILPENTQVWFQPVDEHGGHIKSDGTQGDEIIGPGTIIDMRVFKHDILYLVDHNGSQKQTRASLLSHELSWGECNIQERKICFIADGNSEHLNKLPTDECICFINNGPVANVTLKHIDRSLRKDANLILMGSSKEMMHAGGINQNGTDQEEDNDWGSYVERWGRKGLTFTDMPPSMTRGFRFKISDIPDDIQEKAISTALMFMASRPVVPPRFLGFEGHVRLNASNAYICKQWRRELRKQKILPKHQSEETLDWATQKARKYVVRLIDLQHIGNGKGDTPTQIQAQITQAVNDVGLDDEFLLGEHISAETAYGDSKFKLTDYHWNVVFELATICFAFTYEVFKLARNKRSPFVGYVYRDGAFGYNPSVKDASNPGDVFMFSHQVKEVRKFINDHFVTLTPKYDLQSVEHAAAWLVEQNGKARLHGGIRMDEVGKGTEKRAKAVAARRIQGGLRGRKIRMPHFASKTAEQSVGQIQQNMRRELQAFDRKKDTMRKKDSEETMTDPSTVSNYAPSLYIVCYAEWCGPCQRLKQTLSESPFSNWFDAADFDGLDKCQRHSTGHRIDPTRDVVLRVAVSLNPNDDVQGAQERQLVEKFEGHVNAYPTVFVFSMPEALQKSSDVRKDSEVVGAICNIEISTGKQVDLGEFVQHIRS